MLGSSRTRRTFFLQPIKPNSRGTPERALQARFRMSDFGLRAWDVGFRSHGLGNPQKLYGSVLVGGV